MSRYKTLIKASSPYAYYSFDYSNNSSTQIVDEISNRHPLNYVGQKDALGIVPESLQHTDNSGNSLLKNANVDPNNLAGTKRTGHLETTFSNDFNVDNGVSFEFLMGYSTNHARNFVNSSERYREINIISIGNYSLSCRYYNNYLEVRGNFNDRNESISNARFNTNIAALFDSEEELNYIPVTMNIQNVGSNSHYKIFICGYFAYEKIIYGNIKNVSNISIFKNTYDSNGDLKIYNHEKQLYIKNVSFFKRLNSLNEIRIRHASIFNRDVISNKYRNVSLLNAQSITKYNFLKTLNGSKSTVIYKNYLDGIKSVPTYVANVNDGERAEAYRFDGSNAIDFSANRIMIKPLDTSLQCVYSYSSSYVTYGVEFGCGLWTGVHGDNYSYMDRGVFYDTSISVTIDKYDSIVQESNDLYINDILVKTLSDKNVSVGIRGVLGCDLNMINSFRGYVAEIDVYGGINLGAILNNCDKSYILSGETRIQGIDTPTKVFLYDGISGELEAKTVSDENGEYKFLVNSYKPYIITSQSNKLTNTPILSHGLIYPSLYV